MGEGRSEALLRGDGVIRALVAACPGFRLLDGRESCGVCKGQGVVLVMPSGFDDPVRKAFGWDQVRFGKNVDGVRTRMVSQARDYFPKDRVHIGPCLCVEDSEWSGEFVMLESILG